jgi:hypothetical protein
MLRFFRRHTLLCSVILVIFAAVMFYAGAHDHADSADHPDCAFCHLAHDSILTGLFAAVSFFALLEILVLSTPEIPACLFLKSLNARAPPKHS